MLLPGEINLSQWAKLNKLDYSNAHTRWKEGKIPGAYKGFDKIIHIPVDKAKTISDDIKNLEGLINVELPEAKDRQHIILVKLYELLSKITDTKAVMNIVTKIIEIEGFGTPESHGEKDRQDFILKVEERLKTLEVKEISESLKGEPK